MKPISPLKRWISLGVLITGGWSVSQLSAQPYMIVTESMHAWKTISIVDDATETVVATPAVGTTYNPAPYALKSDQSRAYIGLFNEYSVNSSGVSILDVNTMQQIGVISVAPGVVRPAGVQLSGDETRLVAFSQNGYYNIIDVEAGSATENTVIQSTYVGGEFKTDTERSPDGGTIYGINYTMGIIAVDIATGNWSVVSSDARGEFMEISPDGATAYQSNWGGSVMIVDIATGGIDYVPVPVASNPYDLALSGDGSTLYVASDNHGEIWIFDTASRQFVGSVATQYTRARQLGLNTDGSKLYIGAFVFNGISQIQVMDTATNQMVGLFGSFRNPQYMTMVRGAASNPDTDGDGVSDNDDAFPLDPTESVDSDGDGVGDNSDAFPLNSTESVDSDGDGVGDNSDAFPLNSTESVDSDGDGVGDNSDAFPLNPTESVDSDGDGVGDNADLIDSSILTPTVIIQGMDSGVVNTVNSSGISLADLILYADFNCSEDAKNHGNYVSCMAKYLNVLKKSGVITNEEKKALQKAAAQSEVGKLDKKSKKSDD
jgi:hypothetical protein